ncbi:hypothetical protein [Rhodococcus sp. IEGM 1374]|uniref:hypothetical protein n=1 Tax=Rhodococcus sp. IEGM 1374 TaxID=3082221 RepID=UPI002955CF4A|nr:hypothetical protein [Rhodococcus sp. IEGM 1374]MDV7990500.1 hypothetical protein [Rhodococcus sp. IEGM 1374]
MPVPAKNNDRNNYPVIETSTGMERYMGNLDFDDEVEQFEAIASYRSMQRGIKLYEQGCAIAGNDQVAQRIVQTHVQAFTDNQLARAARRQQ